MNKKVSVIKRLLPLADLAIDIRTEDTVINEGETYVFNVEFLNQQLYPPTGYLSVRVDELSGSTLLSGTESEIRFEFEGIEAGHHLVTVCYSGDGTYSRVSRCFALDVVGEDYSKPEKKDFNILCPTITLAQGQGVPIPSFTLEGIVGDRMPSGNFEFLMEENGERIRKLFPWDGFEWTPDEERYLSTTEGVHEYTVEYVPLMDKYYNPTVGHGRIVTVAVPVPPVPPIPPAPPVPPNPIPEPTPVPAEPEEDDADRYNLTISYKSADGKLLGKWSDKLKADEKYSVPSPSYSGMYTYRSVVAGTMPHRDVSITVVYTPLPTPPIPDDIDLTQL